MKNQKTKDQARDLYRTVRMLKDRLCHKFQARARNEGATRGNCSDITFTQSNALMAIKERGELSLKELADTLHVSPPSASAMVDRLVEMDLVVREQSTVDRREVRICLSEVGLLHFQEMEEQILEYITELLLKLGPVCSAQWCEVYQRIREIIEVEMARESVPDEKKDAAG